MGVLTWASSWHSKAASPGAKIDLVIERDDRVVNLCEIKYAQSEFEITKEYADDLRHKTQAFLAETKTRLTPFPTLITMYGLKPGGHANAVRTVLTMDALFAPAAD